MLIVRGGLEKWVGKAYVVLHNARHNDRILRKLRRYRYDETRLDGLLGDWADLETLHRRQQQEYGEQLAATDALYARWDEVDQSYEEHYGLVDILFGDDRERDRTLLRNKAHRRASVYDWLDRVSHFYGNLMDDADAITALDATFGVTRVDLERAQRAVVEVRQLDILQEQEKTEAQESTEARDEAFLALEEEVNRLEAVAKIALRDEQLLEQLFIRPIP